MIILVILIAAILRFWQLGSVPPALDWDEVSNAYNGYSILKTGRDEFGQFLPILFRAYDGYVPPVLIYLNTLAVSIFGLNEFAARLPNALLGVLTVWGVYLLVRQLNFGGGKRIAILSALLLAITPWHILYSRVNTFALTPLFFVVFGTYFFLKSLTFKKFFAPAILFFVGAVFSYFSAYIFVPLFVLVLALIYRKNLGLVKLLLIIAPVVFSAILILFILPGGQNRLRGISIFSDPDLLKVAATEAENEGIVGKVLHNRRIVYSVEILKGYFANFRGDFLFSDGDAVERMVVGASGSGLLLLWFLPFLLYGVFHLVDRRPDGWQIWIAWLLLAPVAASVALPQPVSTRSTLAIVPLAVLTAYGFVVILERSDRISFKNNGWILKRVQDDLTRVTLIMLLTFNLFLFLHHYFVHFPIEKSDKWFWGYRQLFDYLNSDQTKTKQVHFFFSQPDRLDQVHMFNLFYNRVDPRSWQANGGTRLGCIGTTGQFSFARYDFVPYSCLTKPVDFENYNNDDLVVTSRDVGTEPLKIIRVLDGSAAFYVWEYAEVQGEISNLTNYSSP